MVFTSRRTALVVRARESIRAPLDMSNGRWDMLRPMTDAKPSPAQAHLSALLAELGELRVRDPARVAHFERARPSVSPRIEQVPLVHAAGDAQAVLAILRAGELRSRKARRLRPLPSELLFGISNVAYCSAGVLYPQRCCALIFSHEIEHGQRVEASPWDTGTLAKLPDRDQSELVELYQRYTLPAPEYRTYLIDYVASCFSSVDSYVTRQLHRYSDPAHVMSQNSYLRSAEVRLGAPLPVRRSTLLAVFVPRTSEEDDEELELMLKDVEGQGVHVERYSGNDKKLRGLVESWIIGYLNKKARILS